MGDSVSADVVVVGSGPAGLFAALEAARAGLDVAVIEARAELGGNGAFSTGYMAFADFTLQREVGIVDSVDEFVVDMVRDVEEQRAAGYEAEFDVELASIYAAETRHAFDAMTELGFQFGRFVKRPRQHTVDRMVVLARPDQFREIMTPTLLKAGATSVLPYRVTALSTMGGRVVGVVAVGVGKRELEVRARAGVVVASGGYQASPELRRRYRPDQDPRSHYKGLDTARGDGHELLSSIGARMVNMEMIVEQVSVASRFVEDAIAVNEAGMRFHDEPGPYPERLAALRAQPGGIGYYLYDRRVAERQAQLIAEMPGKPRRFGSLGEVARAIDCPRDRLEATVQRWNRLVDGGVDRDPEFGRVVFPEPRIGLRDPPFCVIPMQAGVMPTVGGAAVSVDLEVLHQDGSVVPGVRAVGDAMGLVNTAAGLGGVHLSSAVTLGRRAGRLMAQ